MKGENTNTEAQMAPDGAGVDVTETRITTAGVIRCCLMTVALDHLDAGRKVQEGAVSARQHCKRTFTLRKPIRGKMAGQGGNSHDGGAARMEELSAAFQTGWRHGIPSWLESYVQQAQNEADPEWAEFQRLQAKFKNAP